MKGQSDQIEQETLNKIESIVNFKELYYQQRERRIQLQRLLELQRTKVKTLSNNGRSKARYCHLCSANISSKKDITKDDNEIIGEFKNFSSKLSTMKFTSTLPYNAQPSLISKIEQFDSSQKRHVGMIQNFAIFGIKESTIKQFVLQNLQSTEFQGEILYSKKEKNDSQMQASRLVFPSGMVIKKYSSLKAKQKTIQLMSYCYTNLKSFVLSFECPDSNFKNHFHHNDLLNHMNPDHRLFCICIGIHDYTYIDKKNEKLNNSLSVIQSSEKEILSQEELKIRSQGHQNLFQDKKQSIKSIDDGIDSLKQLEIGITQRVFCIMTYFPFFSFFQDILRNLINIVKMDRLVVYKHNEQNIKLTIKQTDSQFQSKTIVKYFEDIMKDLQYKKLSFNKEYELRLINQQKITQMTYWDEAKSFFVRQWIYSILSMFSLQTFLQIFTLVMLEDKVVFICENSHILTHTIHLFAHVLTKPLNYSFPVVSIIPSQEDFLNAPFPVVYGMLKKRKSLEQKRILENYDITYVFLSPQKVDVYYQQDRKKLLNNKSTKLSNNKQLKQLFKDLKKTRKKEVKYLKYELESADYSILANADEKQRGVKIVNLVSQYINEQIIKKLPSQIQIENLRKKVNQEQLNQKRDEHTYLMGLIIANFKKTCKDPFVMQILNTQMINNFLFTQT